MTAAWGFEKGSASPSPSPVKLSQGAGTQGHLFLTVLPPQAHWSHTDLGVASSQHSKLSHGNSSLAQGHRVTQASISPLALSWNSSVRHIDCGKTYFSEILCARQLRLARHEWELFCKGLVPDGLASTTWNSFKFPVIWGPHFLHCKRGPYYQNLTESNSYDCYEVLSLQLF